MKGNKVLSTVAVLPLLFQTGCYTNLRVNFGIGTGHKTGVKDTQTGQEVQIALGNFRKVGHDHRWGQTVETPAVESYYFVLFRPCPYYAAQTPSRVSRPDPSRHKPWGPEPEDLCGSIKGSTMI